MVCIKGNLLNSITYPFQDILLLKCYFFILTKIQLLCSLCTNQHFQQLFALFSYIQPILETRHCNLNFKWLSFSLSHTFVSFYKDNNGGIFLVELCLSVCLSHVISICVDYLFMYKSRYFYIYLSIYVSIYLSVGLSVL